ncbi:hypothetical protein H6F96_15305 [Microcoleus sp. FACHB-53]|nr:hypothetical protein [Microcoleus sp. FACHB-53]
MSYIRRQYQRNAIAFAIVSASNPQPVEYPPIAPPPTLQHPVQSSEIAV